MVKAFLVIAALLAVAMAYDKRMLRGNVSGFLIDWLAIQHGSGEVASEERLTLGVILIWHSGDRWKCLLPADQFGHVDSGGFSCHPGQEGIRRMKEGVLYLTFSNRKCKIS
jgi:hypothetical protein